MAFTTPPLSSVFRFFGRATLVLHVAAAWLVTHQVWLSGEPPTAEETQSSLIILWGLASSAALLCALFFGFAQLLEDVVRTATNTTLTAKALRNIVLSLRQEPLWLPSTATPAAAPIPMGNEPQVDSPPPHA